MDLLDELHHGVVPADGALGPVLRARGAPADVFIEEFCATQPDIVREVHAAYLAAGARLLRTNSFGANAPQLAKRGCEHGVGELNWLAAQLAVSAATGSGAHVAACVGPLGAEVTDQLSVFEEQMGALLDGGARVVLLEAFGDLRQLLAALEAKHTLHHCPVIASVVCDSHGAMPDGTAVADAFARLRAAEADVIGAIWDGSAEALGHLLAARLPDTPLAIFATASRETSAANFAETARALAQSGVRLIGGGCGTGPEHIAAFTEALAVMAT